MAIVLKFVIISLMAILSIPFFVHAATQTLHYRGDIEFGIISGSSCGNAIKRGDLFPIELVVRISDDTVEGYYSGEKILTGFFIGNKLDQLSVAYLGKIPDAQITDRLSLDLTTNKPSGELREKTLGVSETGCNFELARLTLVPDKTGDTAEQAFVKLSKIYVGDYIKNQAGQMFAKGNMPEAIKFYEAEIKLLEEIEGVTSEALIEPLMILSIAYCASDRFDKGKELQDRLFAILTDPLKRKIWRIVDLQKRFVQQAKRLDQDGKTDKAIALLEKAVATYPDLTGLYVDIAVLMVDQGDAQDACGRIETAWSSNRADINLQVSQAVCLVRKGRLIKEQEGLDSAIEIYKKAMKLAPDNIYILEELKDAYLANGDPDAALALVTENADLIIKEYSQKHYDVIRAAVYAGASSIAVKKKDYATAESKIRTSLELDPGETNYAIKLASTLHKAGRFEDAMKILNNWLKNCPDASCREQTGSAIEQERNIETLLHKLSKS